MAKPASDNLYPLHRGPFLFGPEFLSPQHWFPSFHKLIERTLGDCDIRNAVVEPYNDARRAAIIEFTECEMTIDSDGGLFGLDALGWRKIEFECSSEKEDRYWIGPLGSPKQFLKQLLNPRYVARIGVDYRSIKRFSELLNRRMEERFTRALKGGTAQLMCRKDSPFSAPMVLDPWQLKYLKPAEEERESCLVDDRELDDRTGIDGTKLFGLGVCPVDKVPLRSRNSRTLTKKDRRSTVNWLAVDPIIKSEMVTGRKQSEVYRCVKPMLSALPARQRPKKTSLEVRIQKFFQEKKKAATQ